MRGRGWKHSADASWTVKGRPGTRVPGVRHHTRIEPGGPRWTSLRAQSTKIVFAADGCALRQRPPNRGSNMQLLQPVGGSGFEDVTPTRLWARPKMQSRVHWGPGAQTLESSPTCWGPGGWKLQPLLHFGAPEAHKCKLYNSLGTQGIPGADNCNPFCTLELWESKLAALTLCWGRGY